MSDTSFSKYEQYGTNAERLAFTPDPPAVGQPLYTWFETDTGDLYIYDTTWHLQIPSGGGVGVTGSPVSGNIAVFSAANTITNATSETGTGAVVRATSPTLTTPALGTPSALVLTNATGLVTAGINNSQVTLAKIQNAAANSKLLGSGASGSGAAYAELTLGTNLSMSGTTLNATAGTASANSRILGSGSSGSGSAYTELTAGKNLAIGSSDVHFSVPLTDDGNSGTTKTIDFDSSPRSEHKLTLTGNVTLTLSNPLDGGCYIIKIATGAGSFSVTWPASVLWPGGVTPTITTTASKVDLVTLLYDSTATKYYGSINQNY